jgi:hypothetical protein
MMLRVERFPLATVWLVARERDDATAHIRVLELVEDIAGGQYMRSVYRVLIHRWAEWYVAR